MILYDYMKKRNGVGRTGAVKWALSKEEFDLLGILTQVEGGLQRMIPPLTLAEICVVITFGWRNHSGVRHYFREG